MSAESYSAGKLASCDGAGIERREIFRDDRDRVHFLQLLAKNPLSDFLREYAASGLGKANQWGDGAWLFQIFAPGCLTAVEDYDKMAITVPRVGTNAKAMEEEFFRTVLSVSHSQKGRP